MFLIHIQWHKNKHTHTHIQAGKPFWILLKQETMGWKWHQLNHMRIICTTL